MSHRTRAIILYVLVPCALYSAFFVAVLSWSPELLGSPPFEVATAVFALVFGWLLYTNRDVLSA